MKSVGYRWQRWAVAHTRFGPDDGVVIHERLVDAAALARLHERTPMVICWGVTDAARAQQLRDLGIGGLIIDDLTLIGRGDSG